MQDRFDRFAQWLSQAVGTWEIFFAACAVVLAWAILGPIMHFPDTWQLIISTISSVVTFLMVFVIQYSQNKDTKALQLKLDELIRSSKRARNEFVKIEDEPEHILEEEEKELSQLVQQKKEDKTK